MAKYELSKLFEYCEIWAGPLGPFVSHETRQQEITDVALEFGPDAALELVNMAKAATKGQYEFMLDLSLFLGEYMRAYPAEFTDAILTNLEKDGPPILLDALQSYPGKGISHLLLHKIEWASADEDLRISLIGALGHIKDPEGIAFLKRLDPAELGENVKEELEIALHNLRLID